MKMDEEVLLINNHKKLIEVFEKQKGNEILLRVGDYISKKATSRNLFSRKVREWLDQVKCLEAFEVNGKKVHAILSFEANKKELVKAKVFSYKIDAFITQHSTKKGIVFTITKHGPSPLVGSAVFIFSHVLDRLVQRLDLESRAKALHSLITMVANNSTILLKNTEVKMLVKEGMVLGEGEVLKDKDGGNDILMCTLKTFVSNDMLFENQRDVLVYKDIPQEFFILPE